MEPIHKQHSAGSWVATELTTISEQIYLTVSLIRRDSQRKSPLYLTRNTKYSAAFGLTEPNTKLMVLFTALALSKTEMFR